MCYNIKVVGIKINLLKKNKKSLKYSLTNDLFYGIITTYLVRGITLTS